MAGNRGFRWIRSDFGATTQPPMLELYVKASQTLYKGNVLRISATSGHGSVGIAAETDTVLYGIAVGDKTTTATELTTKMQVIPFLPGHVFEARGAVATMTGKGRRYLNQVADLEITTAGYSRIDTGGAIKAFRIVGWDPRTEATTGAGRLWHLEIVPSAANYNAALET